MAGFRFGYDLKDRKLIINEAEAKIVRRIFDRFIKSGSPLTIVAELGAQGIVNRYGKPIDRTPSTSSCTIASTSARRFTRASPIPESTRR